MRLAFSKPARVRALHIGGYWRGANDMVRQMMLGLRAAGVEVMEYPTDEHAEALDTDGRPYDRGTFGPIWLREEILDRVILGFEPHLIVCNAGGLSFRPGHAARLRQRRTLLGVALSEPDVFAASTSRISHYFDLFLTNSPECVPKHRAGGACADVLPIATNEEFFHPVPPRPDVACDVLVLGRAHPDRIESVRELSRHFDTHLYGEGWKEHGLVSRGTISGQDVLAALSAAKTTVVFFRTGAGHPLVKVGLFDFAAAGALVVTNRFSEVERYFEYDREIVGFDGTAELVAKVRWLLANPDQADAIRHAGRERVLREHTWRKVWPGILQRLSELPG